MATMKDGIIKRGSTYSYVVREPDPATGKTKPRWHGGFRTRTEP
jgi:integrase